MINPRLALRTLFKTPFVTIVAIVSLALGIGANAGVFSIFNQVILKPLPVPDARRLVNLVGARAEAGLDLVQLGRNLRRGVQLPDVSRSRAGPDLLHRHCRARPVLGQPGLRRAHHQRRGRARVGQLLPGAWPPAGSLGRLLRQGDDAALGESHVVVLSHAYWQRDFDGRARRAQQDADRQRPGDDDRRRGAAGIRRAPRSGPRPLVFVPITMRGSDEPRVRRASTTAAATGPTCSPASSRACPLEAARTAINGPYRSILNDVEAPLQKGMSDQTMARFRKKQVTPRRRVARTELRRALKPARR